MSVLLDSLDSRSSWNSYFLTDGIKRSSVGRYTAALAAELTISTVDSHSKLEAGVCKCSSAPCCFTLAATNEAQLSSSLSSASSLSSSADSSDGEDFCDGHELRKISSCLAGVHSYGGVKKRVQFADELGQQLTRIRVLSEASDMPPRLSHCVIRRRRRFSTASGSKVAKSAASTAFSSSSSTTFSSSSSTAFSSSSSTAFSSSSSAAFSSSSSAVPGCRLQCRFMQPESSFVLFNERINNNGVCLANVECSSTGREVNGVIVVKNLCYRKRVFARITLDRWSSHADVEAKFVDSDGDRDRFEFEFRCPAEQASDLELCVCFVSEDGQEHWDNNAGVNYLIGVVDFHSLPAYTPDFKPSFAGVADFAEFSAWDHFCDSVYY